MVVWRFGFTCFIFIVCLARQLSATDNSREPMSTQANSVFELTRYGLQLIDNDEFAKAKTQLLKAANASKDFSEANQELLRSANLLASYSIDFNYSGENVILFNALLISRDIAPQDENSPLYSLGIRLEECLREVSNCHLAADLYEQVLRESLDTSEEIRALCNLGTVRFAQKDFSAARMLFAKALSLSKAKHSVQERGLAFSWLGLLSEREGKWKESATAYREALILYEKYYGKNHIFVAGKLRDLGRVLSYLGEGYEAEALHLRAHALFEKKYGRMNPHTLDILGYVGNSQYSNHNFKQAAETYFRLLDAQLNFPSLNLHVALATFQDVALSYFEIGRKEDALKLFLAARSAMRQCGCGDFDNRIQIELNLMNILIELNQKGDAELIAREAYQKILAERGPRNPQLISALNGIAMGRMSVGDYFAALQSIDEAVNIAEEQVGGTYPHLMPILHNLTVALEHVGQLPAAQAKAQDIISLHDEGLLQDSVTTVMMLEHAAKLQEQVGASNEDRAGIFEQMVRGYQKLLKPQPLQYHCDQASVHYAGTAFLDEPAPMPKKTVLSAGFSGADLAPIDYDPWDRWTVLTRVLNESVEQMDQKHLYKAIQILEAGLDEFPEQPVILRRLGDIYNLELPDGEKDPKKAADFYDAAILSGAADQDVGILYSRAAAALRQSNWSEWMTFTARYYEKAYFQLPEADRLKRARSALCKFRGHSEEAQKLKIDCTELE